MSCELWRFFPFAPDLKNRGQPYMMLIPACSTNIRNWCLMPGRSNYGTTSLPMWQIMAVWWHPRCCWWIFWKLSSVSQSLALVWVYLVCYWLFVTLEADWPGLILGAPSLQCGVFVGIWACMFICVCMSFVGCICMWEYLAQMLYFFLPIFCVHHYPWTALHFLFIAKMLANPCYFSLSTWSPLSLD